MGQGFKTKGKASNMAATAQNWRNGRQSAIDPPSHLNQDIEADLNRAIDLAIDLSSTQDVTYLEDELSRTNNLLSQAGSRNDPGS